MNLRTKLLLTQGPMVLALVLVAGASSYVSLRLGAAPGHILHDNFRSIDAARAMGRTRSAIDTRVLAATLQGPTVGRGPCVRRSGTIDGCARASRLSSLRSHSWVLSPRAQRKRRARATPHAANNVLVRTGTMMGTMTGGDLDDGTFVAARQY